jgi:hypothetical protein
MSHKISHRETKDNFSTSSLAYHQRKHTLVEFGIGGLVTGRSWLVHGAHVGLGREGLSNV